MQPRPLRDQGDDAGADDTLLGRLMRSVGPLPPSEVRKRRVLTALRSRASTGRRRSPAMRTAMAAALLVLVGGIAGATVGRAAWDRLVAAPPAPPPAAPSAPVAHTYTTLPSPLLAAVPAPAMPAAAATPPGVDGSRADARAAVRASVRRTLRPGDGVAAARAEAQARPATSALAALQGDEDAPAKLVIAAKKALNDADPDRARVLLDDYLSHYPDGPLAEGALTLAIQAAATQNDPETATLARRYLARFPAGQFSKLARDAIARFSAPAAH